MTMINDCLSFSTEELGQGALQLLKELQEETKEKARRKLFTRVSLLISFLHMQVRGNRPVNPKLVSLAYHYNVETQNKSVKIYFTQEIGSVQRSSKKDDTSNSSAVCSSKGTGGLQDSIDRS